MDNSQLKIVIDVLAELKNGGTIATSCSNFKLEEFIKLGLWETFVTAEKIDLKDLINLDSLFQPKLVHLAHPRSLALHDPSYLTQSPDVTYTFTENAGQKGIEDFLAFTKETFYSEYGNWYHPSDIERLKIELPVFFSSDHFLIRHCFKGEIVAMLAVCKIKQHPFFKEDIWHIGYWGIRKGRDLDRKDIKNVWLKYLNNVNVENSIVSNIDYFNDRAFNLAKDFKFKFLGIRLDPRKTVKCD